MNKNVLAILLIILALVCVIFNKQISENFAKKTVEQEEVVQEIQNVSYDPIDTDSVIDVPVNEPTALSYKTKDEIYSIRTDYVQKSIFKNSAYKPSDDVLGAIDSGKPWVCADLCRNMETKLVRVDGPSEEARFLNNPSMLVAIEYPFTFSNGEEHSWCINPDNNLIPKKITYDGVNKEITVVYEHLPFTTNGNHSFYTFNGLNARDLGYKWAYIDSSKSTYNVDFVDSENMANQVIEFQNYIHLGSSCGHSSGCNNGSPRQSYLEFKENNTEYLYQNREIYIKLWKNKPKSPSDKPDIIERIMFNWS